MAQQNRQWFFDAQPTSDGVRFRTKNIPEEDTYKTLVNSVAFLTESDDAAKTGAQGLIKLYTPEDAIKLRYTPPTANTEIRAIESYQLPGVGVLKSGAFSEPGKSTASAISNPIVIGQGIRVTAVEHTQFTFNKLSYQVELDPSTLPVYTRQPDSVLKVITYDVSHNAIGLKDYLGDKYWSQHRDPSTLWTVDHNLGKFPSVVVSNLSGEEINGTIRHLDINSLTIEFNQSATGTVSCN